MDKLFILADDLTGALDTGVCFANAGIRTCVRLPGNPEPREGADEYQVEVAIVESRHMTPQDASRAVFETVSAAKGGHYTYVYKKTDSALRGNIGAELAATLNAVSGDTLHFLPAFPRMKRITRNGVLYIDGDTPVAESVFAADPFNPVQHSNVLEILSEQTKEHAYLAKSDAGAYSKGIAVHDAASDEEILAIGRHLVHEVKATLFAGCAGFANVLPQLIDFEIRGDESGSPRAKLAVFCGSVNPISLEQCSYAQEQGSPRFHLQQNGRFLERNTISEQMIEASREHDIVILDTGAEDLDSSDDDVYEQSTVVAKQFSTVIANFHLNNPDATLFIIGGDTLLAYARNIGIREFIPIREIRPGVVLSRYRHHEKWSFLITKSGGFGSRNLLEEILYELRKPVTDAAGEGA